MSHSFWGWIRLSGLAVWLSACGAGNPDAPLRSPSQDYRPPPPDTIEGQPVGADGVPPGDRLEEGAVVGNEPGLAPGWQADEHGVHHHGCAKHRGEAVVFRYARDENFADRVHGYGCAARRS